MNAPLAFRIWLALVLLFAGWPLGSLGLRLIHALTGGRWGDSIRPALDAGIRAMPILILALIPLAFGMKSLYPWLGPGWHHFYLNLPFFLGRLIFYLIAWIALALFARRRTEIAPAAAAPALILLILTANFWTIDAAQSLDPQFNSSIFGLAALAGMTILALAVAILRAPSGEERDLSRLLLGLVIFWAYLEFVQALIVWESDLLKEISWYLPRLEGNWGVAAWVIAGGHFILPFFLLLSPKVRASAWRLKSVACLIVATQALYWIWIVLPTGGIHG